jgi:hypothetical protein
MQHVFQLGNTQVIVAAALEVQVIGSKRDTRDVDLGDQGNPPSESLLEWFHLWQEPMGFPEIGLPAEMDHAWARDLPSGQSGLTMKGRACLGTLRQFYKLALENIVEAQLFARFRERC